jgi:hypothetical protein
VKRERFAKENARETKRNEETCRKRERKIVTNMQRTRSSKTIIEVHALWRENYFRLKNSYVSN